MAQKEGDHLPRLYQDVASGLNSDERTVVGIWGSKFGPSPELVSTRIRRGMSGRTIGPRRVQCANFNEAVDQAWLVLCKTERLVLELRSGAGEGAPVSDAYISSRTGVPTEFIPEVEAAALDEIRLAISGSGTNPPTS